MSKVNIYVYICINTQKRIHMVYNQANINYKSFHFMYFWNFESGLCWLIIQDGSHTLLVSSLLSLESASFSFKVHCG